MHPQVVQDHPGDCPICHMALTPLNDASASAGVPNSNQAGPAVTIDPLVVQNMGVRTAEVARGPLHKTVQAVGILNLPEPGMHDVALKIGGWIDKLDADQDGMHVHKDEVLFELYSPDLQVAQQELISALKAQRSLPSDTASTIRQEAQGLVDSATRKLRLWDVAEQDIDAIAKADAPLRDVPFRSPADGHVEDKMIVQGSAVSPGMKLMRVADHTKMWLDAQVYADQIPLVQIGQKAVARADGLAGRVWSGVIKFIYPHLDHMTRTLTVRMTLDNSDFVLKPGMYANVEIATPGIADAIVAPREAVIDTGTRQIAFVVEGEGHFTPRLVRMGMMGDDDQVQILEGLAPGENVVTSGQFLLDVESRTIEATLKLSEGKFPSQAPPEPVALPMPQTAPSKDTNVATRPAAVAAATAPTQPQLKLVYCPMAKANWLQPGDTVANPYLGTQMPTCGEVQRVLTVPSADPGLDQVVHAYLDVAQGLDVDRFDAASAGKLRKAAAQLAGEKFAALREVSGRLARAADLKTARAAFQAVSDQLIAILGRGRQ